MRRFYEEARWGGFRVSGRCTALLLSACMRRAEFGWGITDVRGNCLSSVPLCQRGLLPGQGCRDVA